MINRPLWAGPNMDPEYAALTPYQTYYIVAAHGPMASGDFSIAVTESPVYAGVWVNPAYNGGDGGPDDAPAKIVVKTANLFQFYANDTDTTPTATMSFDLARDWTDAVYHYFEGEGTVAGTSTHAYFLIGLSDNNSTLRITSSTTGYPTSLDTSLDYSRL
ncbi:MAG TPA: hypothetical protein VFB30_06335 [Spirochaetia bacterium]|nr:hypothetical protein [Spirochaetia bacterium]